MKIRFVNLKGLSNLPLKLQLKPSIKKYWMGQLIYIGTRRYYMVIDKRGIKTFQDFADILTYPKSWYIIRKFKAHK